MNNFADPTFNDHIIVTGSTYRSSFFWEGGFESASTDVKQFRQQPNVRSTEADSLTGAVWNVETTKVELEWIKLKFNSIQLNSIEMN